MSGSAESLLRFIRTQRFVNPGHPTVEAVAYRISTRIGGPNSERAPGSGSDEMYGSSCVEERRASVL